MRYIPIVALVSLLAGCGKDSPTAPTPTPQPTPQPAPAPPPAPVFLNMVAGWSGRLTITAVIQQTGDRGSNICDQSWIVTAQDGGTFRGTFQSSGGTFVACAQSGGFTGTITTSSTLQSLGFDVAIGAAAACSRISGDGTMTGVVSSSGNLTAQSSDRIRCPVNGVNYDADRTLSLEMTKR